MYTYIMQRTQIYLSRRAASALAREARKSGRTRSQLIREAIDARFLGGFDPEDLERAILAAAGCWRRRRSSGDGASYVEKLRRGRLARIHRDSR
jgi:ribbon-helix-helix CopG family protein